MNNPRSQLKISLMDILGQYRLIAEEVLSSIQKVLESGQYILGPQVFQFEEEFVRYCGAKYCIGTSSGTMSLELGLRALDIGPEDEIITVPNTFTATAEAIALVGARIIFCDVDSRTMNMSPDSLRSKITKKTKAVIPVHLYGNPVDMDEIFKITKPKNIAVIEDASQACGSRYKGKMIGSLKSEFTCFSFHPVKNLGAYDDAGAITTNNSKLARKIRLLSNHGRVKHNKYSIIGTNGRLGTLQAAILSVRLKNLNKSIEVKRKLIEYYKKHLSSTCTYIEETKGSYCAYYVFPVLVKKREALVQFLKKNGIETGIHYPILLHMQKAYRFLKYKKGDFPKAEVSSRHVLSLPLYSHIKKSDVEFVIRKIKEFYGKE